MMSAIQRVADRRALVDIVALDALDDDRPFLIASVADEAPIPFIRDHDLEVLKAIRRDIPFAILADPETLTIFRKDRTRSLDPIATIPTADILRAYDRNPDRDHSKLSRDAMVGRIDTWLSDLAGRFRHPAPPGLEIVEAIGLADKLKRSWLRRSIRLACLPPPLYGDELPGGPRHGPKPGDGRPPVGATPGPPARPA